jgi:hypothetical protein
MAQQTAIQQLIEDIRNGNDISFLNDEHIGHYLEIERKQQELISAQRYIDGFNKAKEFYNSQLEKAYNIGWKDATTNSIKEVHKYQ